jgi:hypothetical protein
MRFWTTLALLTAIIGGGIAASANAFTCTSTCSGSSDSVYGRSCTTTCR